MGFQVIVQPGCEGVHELLEPGRALLVLGLQFLGVDEQSGAQFAVQFAVAFGFGQAAQSREVVDLYPVEVVLGLGVHQAKDHVRVSFSVDVGYAPVVPNDRHPLRPCVEPGWGLGLGKGRRRGDDRIRSVRCGTGCGEEGKDEGAEVFHATEFPAIDPTRDQHACF